MERIMNKMKVKEGRFSLVDVVAWRKHVSLALTDPISLSQEMLVVRYVLFTVNSSGVAHLTQSPH
jgi:hypothetical protein